MMYLYLVCTNIAVGAAGITEATWKKREFHGVWRVVTLK